MPTHTHADACMLVRTNMPSLEYDMRPKQWRESIAYASCRR